jgi:hypothetical protein
MFEPERRQAVDVFGFNVIARGYELVQGGVHIDCVPEHDEIHHQSERPELVLLPFAIALAQFATLSMKDGAGELVTSFAAIKLNEDAPAIALVVDKTQEIQIGLSAIGFWTGIYAK